MAGDLYVEARRLVDQARAILVEYEGKEMPGDKAEEFDRLMAASDEAKGRADRQVRVLAVDAELQAKHTTSGGEARFEGFEEHREELPGDLRAVSQKLAAPDVALGRPSNGKAVMAAAEALYPRKSYGDMGYQELLWKHRVGFGKWVRYGTSALDGVEQKLGFGGRVLLTPGQIEEALKGGLGPSDLKDLVEGSDVAGRFLVPEDWRAEIVRGRPGSVVMRPRARVVQTSRDVIKAPKLTGAGTNYSSAVRMTWGPETPAAESHRTEPTFGQVVIPVHTAMASTRLSLDLIEDAATPVEALLRELYVEAFALGEDDSYLTADGNGKPQGLTAAVAGGTIASVASGDANLVTADGLIDVQYALPTQYWMDAVWVMNAASTARAIRKLKDANDDYLWQRGLAAGEPDTLLGKAIAYSGFMPDVAAGAYPVIYGDLRNYWIVDRVGMTLQRLGEKYAEENMVGFVARKRTGGQVVLGDAFRALRIAAA